MKNIVCTFLGDIENVYFDDLLVFVIRWDSHEGGTYYDERWALCQVLDLELKNNIKYTGEKIQFQVET